MDINNINAIVYPTLDRARIKPNSGKSGRLFILETDGLLYFAYPDGTIALISGGGASSFTPSFANLYKTAIQIVPIDTNVTFDNFYKTADIVHIDNTAEIIMNTVGIYLCTVKLNDNGADNRIYRLTLDGGALPNTVNGKSNITGVPPDQSIQVETIINAIVIIDAPGRVLRVNAPLGCGLDTPPVPLSVPIAIKASLTIHKISNVTF